MLTPGKKQKKEPPPPLIPEFIEVEKVVQSYVNTPIIHCHFGPMPEDEINPKLNYMYIIRKTPSAIGKEFSIYFKLKKTHH